MDQRLKYTWGVLNTLLGLWWRHWSIHRITQCLELTGTSKSYPVYSTSSGRAVSSQLFKTFSRQLFSIFRDGDSPVSLDSLCRGSLTLQEKGVSWCSKGGNLLCFLLLPIVSGSSTGHNWKEPDFVFCVPSLQVFISIGKILPKASLPQAEQLQQSQFFLTGEMLQSLNHLHAPYWTLSSMSMSHLQWKIQN